MVNDSSPKRKVVLKHKRSRILIMGLFGLLLVLGLTIMVGPVQGLIGLGIAGALGLFYFYGFWRPIILQKRVFENGVKVPGKIIDYTAGALTTEPGAYTVEFSYEGQNHTVQASLLTAYKMRLSVGQSVFVYVEPETASWAVLEFSDFDVAA